MACSPQITPIGARDESVSPSPAGREPGGGKTFAVGLDAGGTYTDAVLVEWPGGRVVGQAKALTTPQDLSLGIASALDQLDSLSLHSVRLVALATTLATNAIVEKKGGRVGLLLSGYDPKTLAQFNLLGHLPVVARHSLRGRLGEEGRELEPIDPEEVRTALVQMQGQVEALAISGYFSVRNSAHEQQIRAIARDMGSWPIVCGYELTSRLDAVKRAVTAALNARLLPLLRDLLESLENCLRQRGITAPVWMMSGEGRLMAAADVRQRPVETILSGPAASVVAARLTSGRSEAIVIDMGGTTSDIAVLRGGQPGLSPDGALVGGWPTHVNAVDIRTCGLGGDSHIQLFSGRLKIGPRRACPVCLAATEHAQMLRQLRRLASLVETRLMREPEERFPVSLADFIVQVRPAQGLQLGWQERAVLGLLSEGPVPLLDVFDRLDASHLHVQGVDQLEERGLIQRIGLTPTDLLHAEGTYLAWNEEAARLASEIVARQMGLSVKALCDTIREQIVDQLAFEVLGRLLQNEMAGDGTAGLDSYLLRRALDGQTGGAPMQCRIDLRDPLVGLGAPARSYLPRLAEKLHTEYICPPYAEVGVALGTVLAGLDKD